MMKIRKILTTTVLILALITISTTTAAALSCDYDICVNQSGWWRGGGALNTNTTPIQAAVDNAIAGETIFVWNGSYTENVNVNKRLTLQGEGAGAVTVTAASTNDHVFYVTADYVNISGFTATGATDWSKAGIYLNGADHCNISENNASNDYSGICLQSSSNNNTLTSNTANSNDYSGICLQSSSNNNTLTSNTANSNNYYGIYLHSSSNNTLTSNTANSNNDVGIRLYSSSNNTLTNNTASDNDYGIWLHSSSNNTLTNNTASDNGCGIYLVSSSDNMLTSNNASNNAYGIYLVSSSDNMLTNNTANSNDEDGICLRSSNNNNIERNMIVKNSGDAGVHLDDGSDYNEIHENCFIDNMEQAWDDDTDNDWDGNYWSPPPGGSGDYNISGSAGSEDTNPLDVCPLTGPPAALNLSKTDDVSGCVDPGDLITYTICYENPNSAAVHNVTINDTLPAGVTFVAASGGGSYDAGVVTWDIGDLSAGAAETCVTLDVTVNTGTEGQTLTNCAVIESDETDPATACDAIQVCGGEPTPAALNITKTDDVDNCVGVGGTITYTICYDNQPNSVAVHNVTINDTLPAGVTFVSASGGGSYDAGVVTWDIGDLSAGAAETCVTLNVTVNTGTEGQTLTNCAVIESDETEPATACEETNVCGGEPAPPAPTPVPSLTPLGMTLLIGLMLVAGFVTLRRRE